VRKHVASRRRPNLGLLLQPPAENPSAQRAKAQYLQEAASTPPKPQVFRKGLEPARTGREGQVFDGDVRLCAGVVPLLNNQVVIVSSAKQTEWILPKGGWEADESIVDAALRECYEEAGLRGSIADPQAYIETHHTNRRGVPCRTRFFVMHVAEILEHWPEEHRQRKLVDLDSAEDHLKRDMFRQALDLAKSERKGGARSRLLWKILAGATMLLVVLAAVSQATGLRSSLLGAAA